MQSSEALFLAVGLLPVLCFLGALFALDSFRIVRPRSVMLVVALGAIAAVASYCANAGALRVVEMSLEHFSRYVSPLIEEVLKASVVVALIRLRRIGFLVDAAILGFAVGAGFATLENLYIHMLHLIPPSGLGTWIVRGFGTALMHGGTTAIFAVLSVSQLGRRPGAFLQALLPGLAIAVVMHTVFNFAVLAPLRMTLVIVLLLPPLFFVVFRYSERGVRDWLGTGFDADAEMLELLDSGHLSDAPIGRYLGTLRDRFSGPVVADVLCYLRLYTELGLRAKGILMMRENGFEPPVDDQTREKFTEMSYLEGSIGRTGLLAIRPMLHISQKDLMQIYRLGT